MPKQNNKPEQFYYEGFSTPNGTIVPDDVFDVLLPHLSDIELRVLLYVIRRTFGFKKNHDDISLRQIVRGITTSDGRVLDRGAGLSKPSAIKAARLLEQKGILIKRANSSPEKGDEAATYELRFKGVPVSTGLTRGGKPDLQGRVNRVDTQQTGEQETVEQQTDRSSNGFDGETLHINWRSDAISKKEVDRKEAGGRRRAPPPDMPPRIARLVEQVSDEFHDAGHAPSNVGQASRLWAASGRSEEAFARLLLEARARTKRRGNVRTRASGDAGALGLTNRMPYFFAVLRDLLAREGAGRTQR